MRRGFFLFLITALACAACDGDGDPGMDAGPPGPGVDSGAPPDELSQYLEDNDVVILELQEDGTEFGAGLTDAQGIARFYSPVHRGLFELAALAHEDESALEERPVTVSVGDDNMAYLITDPSGVHDPLLHLLELPADGEEAEVEVDATELYAEQAGLEDYDPDGGDANPFAPTSGGIGVSRQPLLVGLAFSLGVRSILKGVLVGAVISVFKNLVESACNVVAPVYAERCALIGNIVGAAGQLLAGIYISAASGWELGATVLDNALNLSGYTCEALGGAVVGYQLDPEGTSAQDRYREIARRFNYLLYKMETDPQPGQPTWEQAEQMARQLLAVRNVVRNRYFELWNDDPSHAALGYGMGAASSATSGFFDNLTVEVQEAVLTRLVIEEAMLEMLEIGPDSVDYTFAHYRYVQADWESFEWSAELSDQGKALNGLLVGCAFNFVQGAIIAYDDGTTQRDHELESREIVDTMLGVFEEGLNETYARVWGEAIPPGDCLADLYEPNGTWQQAVASPVPGMIDGSGVVELRDLTLCDGTGMSGNDEDWYAWATGPLSFNVQTRIIGDDMWDGQDQDLCIDLFWYSEAIELAGGPPEPITGTCGTVSSWPATSPFSVGRVTGVRWSYLMARVRHDTGGGADAAGYGLRFTP